MSLTEIWCFEEREEIEGLNGRAIWRAPLKRKKARTWKEKNRTEYTTSGRERQEKNTTWGRVGAGGKSSFFRTASSS